jgi:hypothetical protein
VKKRNSFGKKQRVGKGAPSGLVISLLFHAGAFFIAGLFVVFTVVKKPELVVVAPPPIERPKMKLQKPKVKVRKSSNPKPSSRIVAKVKTAKMPEITLPDLDGSGDGLLSGAGGGPGIVLDLPDIKEVNVFGQKVSTGSDLKGTFYDLFKKRDGSIKPVHPMTEFGKALSRFVDSGCDKSTLAQYYHSPPLYAVGVMIPEVLSQVGPSAFGQEAGGKDCGWFVHYEGKLVHPTDIKFRFWATGDDLMVILVDKKCVLSTKYTTTSKWTGYYAIGDWQPVGGISGIYYLGRYKAMVSEWIELKAGEALDLDMICGESPGGDFSAMCNVEVYGEEYEKADWGAPILPMFKTDQLSRAQQDAIYEYLVEGESCLTNGPVFCDYVPKPVVLNTPAVTNHPPMLDEIVPEMRTWTVSSGKTVEGAYIRTTLSDEALLRKGDGSEVEVPLKVLSAEDLKYLALQHPPKLKVEFGKQSWREMVDSNFILDPPPVYQVTYQYNVRLRQADTKDYPFKLRFEYFAIGRQLQDKDKYVLLHQETQDVVLNEENNHEFEWKSSKIKVPMEFTITATATTYGRDYMGGLLLVYDERGVIIDYKASKKWLFEGRDKLRELPTGAFFNDECTQVYPTGAKQGRN